MPFPSRYRAAFTVAVAGLTLIGVLPAASAGAVTFQVNTTSDAVDARVGDRVCRTSAVRCSLRAAIQEANAVAGADVIRVPAGVYALAIAPSGSNAATSGDLDVTGAVSIVGAGSSATVLDGGPRPSGSPPERRGLDRLLEIHSTAGDVSLSGLTIREGYSGSQGGGIQNSSPGRLRLQSVRVIDSFALQNGGGVNNAGTGRVELIGSTLSRNSARQGGSAVNNARSGTVTIGIHSTVSSNPGSYPSGAGAILNQALNGARGRVAIVLSTVSDNVAARDGAGIGNAGDGTVVVEQSTIERNRTSLNGGGLHNGSGAMTVSMSKVSGNRASNGGGIFNAGRIASDGIRATVSVVGSSVAGNAATGGGGGIFNDLDGDVRLAGATVSGNSAGSTGGGIRAQQRAGTTVTGGAVSANAASSAGGGLYLNTTRPTAIGEAVLAGNRAGASGGGAVYTAGAGLVDVAGSTLAGNVAGGDGGGVAVRAIGSLAIGGSTLQGNSSARHGGGVVSSTSGSVLIARSTLHDNSAGAYGGGFLNIAGGPSEIVNSTLSANRAAASGGGVYSDAAGGLHVTNATVFGNSAASGGGLAHAASRPGTLLMLRNTIVAGSLSGDSCAGPIGSSGGNLDSAGTCAFSAADDRWNTDPLLQPLAGNGGPTPTHALHPDSPAIDGGVSPCPLVDQRGVARPQGPRCDIGAVEAPPRPPDTTPPETSITTATTGPTATFEFTGTDDRSGATFQCRLDNGDWAACSSPHRYEGLDPGDHLFEVRAVDAAGNPDPTPARHSWTDTPPDTTAPATTITRAPDSTADGTATFEFAGTDNRTEPGDLSFDCRLDGGDWAACASPRTYSDLPAGTHAFDVRAIDEAGYADPSPASHTWTIIAPDTTAPDTELTAAPPSFAFTGSDDRTTTGDLTFECRLDTGDWAACTSPKTYDSLAAGEHSFQVRAIDEAGNTDPTPAGHTWTIIAPDTTAPDTELTAAPPSFAFTGTDDRTTTGDLTFECRLDEGDWGACASPKTYDSLAAGEHTFQVRAIDEAGNADPTPAGHTWTIIAPDTTAPDTELTATPPSFAFTGSDDRTATGDLTFECRLDEGGWGACTSPKTYDSLAAGEHSFQVRAIDAAGNTDPTPASHTWTDDAPDTQLTATPPSFAFTGTDDRTTTGDLTFECRLDNGDWGACASPKTYDALAAGEHTFQVRAIDEAGNADPTPAGHTWTIIAPDTTAPDTELTATPPSFAFTGSDDRTATGDLLFECRLDTGDWGACTSPKTYDALAAGEHSFQVRAIDEAGNTDPSPAGHTWTIIAPDTTAPDTQLTATPPSFAFTGSDDRTATGDLTFECRLDGGGWGACTSPKTYDSLAAGEHSFQVRAIDEAGNTDPTPAGHTWTITAPDTTAPDTELTATPPSFAFTGSDDRTATGDLRFECRLDEGEWGACASPKTYDALAAGEHTFQVRAIDAAGNTDPTPASHTWTDDAPDTQLTAAPPSFAFTGADDRTAPADLTFECRLDTGDWAACTSPKTYDALTPGEHSFQVRAIDEAGNTDPSPASHTWTITAPDTTAPDTQLTATPPSFAFTGTDDRTTTADLTFECRLDEGGWGACASPKTYDSLAAGEHTFQVRAIDEAGNADPTPAGHTWTIIAPDTTAPDTELTATPPSFAFTGSDDRTATGDLRFECRLDEGDWGACTSPKTYDTLTPGEHSFQVRAIDEAGNADPTPAGHTWTITAPDTTAPDTQLTATPPSFAFTGTDDRTAPEELTFQCRLDEGDWGACTSPKTYDALAPGEHTFQVRAIDQAGNTDPSPASHRWTITAPDTTAPDTQLTATPPSFAFTGSDDRTAPEELTFQCRLDEGDWAACESPTSYADVGAGEHTFEVRAIDEAGNTDPTPASHTWTDTSPDTSAPDTTITHAPPEVAGDVIATFRFTGSDDRTAAAGLRFACRLDGADSWSPCASPAEYAGLSLGAHAFEVRATDEAGNTDPTPARHDWKLVDCAAANSTVTAVADAWVDESSPAGNKGADATMRIQATPAASARVLVRFELPAKAPDDCVVESAKLRLYAPSGSDGSTLEARRAAAAWQESSVTWTDQPATVGAAGTTFSGEGYVTWNMSAQVQALLDGAPNHGFLIKDADEGGEGGGSEFHAREKGENPPLLAIRFGPPPVGTPPPPAPPVDARVTCGEELTRSTRVMNDLTDCLTGDGLVIGAHRIIVDLDGHTIDGVGLGTGIRNDGYNGVIIRNGRVHQWDHGIQLQSGTRSNAVRDVTAESNEVTGIELMGAGGPGAGGNEVRGNTITGNGGGIALLAGSTNAVVANNAMQLNTGAHLLVKDSDANRLEGNTVSGEGGGDLGIGLEHARGNVLLHNTVTATSDGGLIISAGAHGNRVEGNVLAGTGDAGIVVDTSDRNELIGNTAREMSDSGISLTAANDGVVKRNVVSDNPGGIQVDGSMRNVIKGNDASRTTGIGIELGGGALDNDVVRNTASGNGAVGIHVSEEALLAPGNRVRSNTASGNGSDGIVTSKGGHTLTENVADDNAGWGINAGPETVDGGGNVARGNREPTQCIGIVCLGAPQSPAPADDHAPETTITGAPESSDRIAVLAFKGSDAVTAEEELEFECRLDGAGWQPCTSPRTYTGLERGAHAFAVRAVDEAGNRDATPAGHAWTDTPDTTAPETEITDAPADESRRRVSFSFTGTDSGGATGGLTFECQLDSRALWDPCTSPHVYADVETGSHTFRVRAVDGSGNADSTAATHTWTVRPSVACPAVITAAADADAWIDENSAAANKGADGSLRLQSKAPRDDTRVLVRFALPTGLSGECPVASATLRMYAAATSEGRTLQALRIASGWTEGGVTWSNQPSITGSAAAAATLPDEGYLEWNVTAHVEAMLAPGANHGFLIRDSAEGDTGFEQGFNSRESGEDVPQLVITFG